MFLTITRYEEYLHQLEQYVQSTLENTPLKQSAKNIVAELLFIENFLKEKFNYSIHECRIDIFGGNSSSLSIDIRIDTCNDEEKASSDLFATREQLNQYRKENNINYEHIYEIEFVDNFSGVPC